MHHQRVRSEHHDGVAIMMMLCHTMCGTTSPVHHASVMCSEHHDGVAIMMMLCHTMCGSNITRTSRERDVQRAS